VFCKVAVADQVAVIVDAIFARPREESGLSLFIALVLFSFQIYYDFLGYTWIARGLAQSFGIRLHLNFDRPYLAASLREFWHRWHITLSTWFRDYVYVPLGGNTRRGGAYAAAILVTFILSGLWHGASSNFVLWGLVHGLLFLGERGLVRLNRASAIPAPTGVALALAVRALRVLVVFLLVSLAWAFFRVRELPEVVAIFRKLLFLDTGIPFGAVSTALQHPSVLGVLALTLVVLVLDSSPWFASALEVSPAWRSRVLLEVAVVDAVLALLLVMGSGDVRQFLYFRF
jgi:alginate O-acetyltransferase complex protein AlgI